MSKDPAFLFYSSDFLTGCMDLTMEERGQYITLICLQHQKGHLTEKTICLSLGSVSVDVLKKFKKDENGLLYNERVEEEIEKRREYAESRRKNGSLGGRPKKPYGKPYEKPYEKPYGKPTENHTENENENESENDKWIGNKIPNKVYLDDGFFYLDNSITEFKDMTDSECESAYRWIIKKLRYQTISKDRFIGIVRKFKGERNGKWYSRNTR